MAPEGDKKVLEPGKQEEWTMKRRLAVIAFVVCFAGLLPQVSWSEEAVQGIFHPLCGSCEKVSHETIEIIGKKGNLTCMTYGMLFSSVCDANTGGADVLTDVVCSAGGTIAQNLCLQQYGNRPDVMLQEAKEASKLICEQVKLCK